MVRKTKASPARRRCRRQASLLSGPAPAHRRRVTPAPFTHPRIHTLLDLLDVLGVLALLRVLAPLALLVVLAVTHSSMQGLALLPWQLN